LWQEKQVKILGIKGGDDKTPAPFKASWAQDVHWFKQHIMFGYFPHYATGLMFGAAMIQRYGQGLGDQETPDQEWRNGDFGPYRRWLCTHFYGYGARQSAQEIAGPLNLGAYSDFIERQATWT
jgi:Zn-dependent M32 family carboxypeptidase